MEQKQLLLALGLSFLVFLIWLKFFAPAMPTKPPQSTQESSQAEPATEQKPAQPAPAVQPSPAPEVPAVVAAPGKPEETRPARSIQIQTPLYRMTLSERGAAVVSMVLEKYRETAEPDSALKELIPQDLKGGTVLVSLSGEKDQALANALFDMDQNADHLDVKTKPATVRFRYSDPSGLQIEKTYTFQPDSYLVGLNVALHNAGSQALQDGLTMTLRTIEEAKQNAYGFEGPSGLINNKLQQIKFKKIAENNKIEGQIRWYAVESLYFMSSLIPKEPVKGQMIMDYKDKLLTNQLVLPGSPIGPQQSRAYQFNLFMGPKSLKLLRSLNNGLDRAINFGWADFIAKPCLWFMNFIYRFIPNYGVAIIILTIVTRMMFWPLATKSYKSMAEMRKLQPLMQELREKYKGDKTKLNQEMMALYKTYKVNPMGGCLPMLIQLPVFLALYSMLYQAIELRHAPFFGWITDLSAPDRLFHFHPSFHVPYMQPPYGIPVLTLIMGASMLLQQKMTPTPGDPAQAKMMMLMPIIFTVIFINFSSGLVIYWLVGNILSMLQQYYVQRKKA